MPVCSSCGHENGHRAKFCAECGSPLAALPRAAAEQRKTVTVLFCDLAGSTALGETLDPERLRALLARYFERMQAIVELHGGTVEKFIGDAVMAVFGVPVIHEDDALRAVRAAAEMRDALPGLGLAGRIGVTTGEVVTGTEERLATGDAVNVAARLEQAAQPGEVLVGEPTVALVRSAVDVEPIEPLALKGKAAPVEAFRLLGVRGEQEQRRTGPFVGRQEELSLLREAWNRVLEHRRCELVTVVGDPGVGKTRVATEFLAWTDATAVRGRCLPYGEGITYWPVVEVLKQLDVVPPDAAAAAVSSVLRETDAVTTAEEIAWAVRKTVERAAELQPLVVLFDDIQWGEETFLDLVEHVALLSSGAPILLLCLARPELTERRPVWPIAVSLGPLKDEEIDELIPERVPPESRERITQAAAGNPLFVEEMVAMAGEKDGELIVPPTLQALLAARLDQLETAERRVLERGAIEGEVFHRGAVQALAPEEPNVTRSLASLVRKSLINPDRPQISGDDGFRFRHLLIREAAYDTLPKATRADLHVRFAAWLEEHGAELVEQDELIGYHLERACAYRAELGLPVDDRVAGEARARLTAAGHRAQLRSDYRAAVSLYERAAALVSPAEVDVSLETEISEALLWSGHAREALDRATSVTQRAAAAGDRLGELCGRIKEGLCRTYLEPEGSTEPLTALVKEALPVFEAAGDDAALYGAHQALGWVAFMRAQTDTALEAFEQAADHARRAGLPHELFGWRGLSRLYGTTPVPEVLAWLDENESRAGRDTWLRAARAVAVAMLGRFDDARRILAETRAELKERGGGLELATATALESAMVELLAGDAATAAVLGAEGCRQLEELGEQGFLSTACGTLAQSLYELDRLDEADAWALRAAELGATDDAFTQMAWRPVKAKVAARRGAHRDAERLAQEAVAIAERTDDLTGQGDARGDLAEVLLIVGNANEAARELRQALERYERKDNRVGAARTRERLGGEPQ